MAGGATLKQLQEMGEVDFEKCICRKKECPVCVWRNTAGCEKCFQPAYSQKECIKCRQEK